jgi:UDP-glucose 4-epimerase
MTSHVLITGGAGFIGSHVAEVFVQKGWNVDIVDDLSSGRRENVPREARLHVADIRSVEASRLVGGSGYEVIVHLAAQMDVRRSVADPVFDANVNVIGSLHLLEAARCAGGEVRPRIVFSSTGGAIYGDLATPPNAETTAKEPDSPYAIAKLATEYYLAYYARIHGIDSVSLRFGNVYGPRQDPHGEAGVVAIFCGRLIDGLPLTIFGDGLQTRDYVHVADVASAVYAAATLDLGTGVRVDDRALNIGTGVATSVRALAATLLSASGATGAAASIEHAPERPGEQRHSFLTVDKARRVLEWEPRVALSDGLAETYSWFAARAATAAPSRT